MPESVRRPLSVFLVSQSELVRRTLADGLSLLPHVEICGEAESIEKALTAITALRPNLVGSEAHLHDSNAPIRVALYAEDSEGAI